jgi:GT2 family glycosyltransferase
VEGGDREPGVSEEVDARAEDALSRFLPTEDGGIVREHHVTALLVAHDGSEWLPRCLAGLADQTRAPQRTIAVDASSGDGTGDLLAGAVPGALPLEEASGIADALRAATTVGWATSGDGSGEGPVTGAAGGGALEGRVVDPGHQGAEPVRWYWILHDDAAPEVGCLEHLLEGADRNPASAVLIPKSVAWSDRTRLVGIGNMWAPGSPSVERLEPGERDQGQYDVDRPVYCGDTAGMLVRADSWHELAGLDSRYDGWGSGADLCRRVWGSGHDVTFIPQAVVAHRQAGRLGVRPGARARPAPRHAARQGQLLLELTQSPLAALPWRWVRGLLSTLVRAVALLLTREPEDAAAELAGAWDVLAHPGRVRAGRRALRLPPVSSTTRPAHVRARRGAVLSHSWDAWTGAWRSPQDRPGQRIGRAVGLPLAIAGALAVVALAREPGQVFGSGSLVGGGLLPAPDAGELLTTYLASWQDVRFGVPSAQPAYLPVLAALSLPLLGSVDLLLRLLVGFAVPLAFLSMYAALGPSVVGRARLPLSLAWAVLPPGAAAMSGGRPSTLGLLLLGPPTVRLVASALAAARGAGPRVRPAIAAGTMLGLTATFAPLVLPVAAVAALVAWLARGTPRWPVRTGAISLAVALGFVLLWVPRVVAAPWLLLSELGRNDPSLGSPEPFVWGLSPGGPTSVAWAGVPLVVAAVLVSLLLRPGVASVLALAAAAILLAATAWTGPLVRGLWPDLDPATVWPGQLLLLAGGLLAFVVARAATGGGAGAGAASVALSACVVVLGVGWWVAPVTAEVGPRTSLPSVVALAEESPERPRTLLLARDAGTVVYGVSTGAQVRLGDADALAAEADPVFDQVVEDLVSGVGADVEVDLGRRAVRYVVLNAPAGDPLAAVLDSSVGLRRLATAEDQSLWLVAGQANRGELIGRSDDPDVVIPITTRPTSVDVVLHPQTLLPRILVLAERADPGWTGSIDGAPLVLSSDGQGMTAAQVTATGRLSLAHTSWWTTIAAGHLLLLTVLVLLALPKRRSMDPHREAAG